MGDGQLLARPQPDPGPAGSCCSHPHPGPPPVAPAPEPTALPRRPSGPPTPAPPAPSTPAPDRAEPPCPAGNPRYGPLASPPTSWSCPRDRWSGCRWRSGSPPRWRSPGCGAVVAAGRCGHPPPHRGGGQPADGATRPGCWPWPPPAPPNPPTRRPDGHPDPPPTPRVPAGAAGSSRPYPGPGDHRRAGRPGSHRGPGRLWRGRDPGTRRRRADPRRRGRAAGRRWAGRGGGAAGRQPASSPMPSGSRGCGGWPAWPAPCMWWRPSWSTGPGCWRPRTPPTSPPTGASIQMIRCRRWSWSPTASPWSRPGGWRQPGPRPPPGRRGAAARRVGRGWRPAGTG